MGPVCFSTQILLRKIDGFDKNIFLYYEENDFFTKCNDFNLNSVLVLNYIYGHQDTSDDLYVFIIVNDLYISKFSEVDQSVAIAKN